MAAALTAFPDRFYGYSMFNPLAGRSRGPRASRLRRRPRGRLPLPGHASLFGARSARASRSSRKPPRPGRAVFVHCGVLTVGVRRKLGLPSLFDMRFSNPIDLHPVAIGYPEVRFLIPHFGAGYLREALMLADLCPNVYLDTSSSNAWMRYEGIDLKAVFGRALGAIGAGRLLFGTDSSFFPRGWNSAIFERQALALADLGIGTQDARLILGENLERVFS